MPGYVIVDVTVRDRDSYERYKQLAAVSVAAHGGRYLVRGGATETLERGPLHTLTHRDSFQPL